MHSFRNRVFTIAALVIPMVGIVAAYQDSLTQTAGWPMFGQNIANTANYSQAGSITAKDAHKLKPKWVATVGGDVSARAAVVDGVVYVPDWGGNLWAMRASDGSVIWSHKISDYGLPPNTHSRTSPAVVDGTVYIGTQEGAYLLAINAGRGSLIWRTQLESAYPLAVITASPTVYNGVIYIGVSSTEETAVALGYPCCQARGSVVAVNAATGSIQWKTFTVPAGYTGGGVWGSNPVVDPALHTVFVGTGNNYSNPTDPAYLACRKAGGTDLACLSPNDHADSILALDMGTGAVKWARRLMNWGAPYTPGSDYWNLACWIPLFPVCPAIPGPDFDFASAPNEITYQTRSGPKKILGAGQKSGIYYALDPVTGDVLWQTQVGPGSELGGMEWGSATDGKRIYVAIANFYSIPYAAGNAGSWAALDVATGAILWRRADPSGAIDMGPVTVVNDVVYVPSMATFFWQPTMLALDAATGVTLWSYAAGSSVNAGASVANGIVYWGSGFTHLPVPWFTGNNKFYAFSTE
jgi:polyvinyl alcohol dehydrogenase (cytochrome)